MHYIDYITVGIALALAVSLIAAYAFGSLPPVLPRRREAAGGHVRGVRLIEVLSVRRETHFRYLWNTRCECRAGSKCAVVSTTFGRQLATLCLRNLSAVSGRSRGEWFLHSELHIPARLASHSPALGSAAGSGGRA